MKGFGFLSATLNAKILVRLAGVDLPDAWLVSGALFQTAWNVLTDRPPTLGIKDYDVFYFDRDVSWEAEDRVIRYAAEIFSDLDTRVEVRNQARVHLWYPQKFGVPYPPLRRTTDGIDRFLMQCAQVGIAASDWRIYAPKGFDDIESLTVRPNFTGNFRAERHFEKAERWKAQWPELTILSADSVESPKGEI